jgi:hypothetical protein
MPNYFNKLPFTLALKYTLLQFCKRVVDPNVKLSFSEFGEDVLIQTLSSYRRSGFFVDVGSNHPIVNSTTFALYLKGWTGLNVDGNGSLIEKAKRVRKKDISVTALISNEVREVEYIKFSNDKLNSINPAVVKGWNESEVTAREKRTTKTLTQVLEEYFPEGRAIDLLSIDVEEHDYEVLTSLDFRLFPVELIVVEMHGYKFNHHPISNYLEGKGYQLLYFSGINGFFKRIIE